MLRMDVVITEFAALVVNFHIQSAVSGNFSSFYMMSNVRAQIAVDVLWNQEAC